MTVNVIGAGLAGCEAAYQLSKRGVGVKLFECKPAQMSPAHKAATFAELVCSNSLKSDDISTAGGLLKAELRMLDSLLISVADEVKVPAGSALAVDRELFTRKVTQRVESLENVEIITRVADGWNDDEINIIATGPLTVGGLADAINEKLGGTLHFYDAAAAVRSILAFSGIRVPEDVLLFTYSHSPSQNEIPSLFQDPAALGRKAARRMLEILNDPKDPPHHIRIPMILVNASEKGDAK